MKQLVALGAVFCLMSVAVFAQKKADFSGMWMLDASKSQLGERSRIEGMSMTVVQTKGFEGDHRNQTSDPAGGCSFRRHGTRNGPRR